MVPDLSISIINTDNYFQTIQCLHSVFASTHSITMEVFVVDNASNDGSADIIAAEFPEVKLIRNSMRLGFSTNNNRVFSRTSGRYLLMLNDDTLVHTGAFEQMVNFMDKHPEAGVAGAKLINPDGTPQECCYFPPHPLYDPLRPFSAWLRPLRCHPFLPSEVGSVCGACMLVRREVIEKVGLLDTDFDPIYSEEIEWCHRIREVGWRVYHLPQVIVTHYGGQTMNRVPRFKLEKLYGHKVLFFRKHYGTFAVWAFKLALFSSSFAKVLGWLLIFPLQRQLAKTKISAHYHITRRALFL